MTERSEDVVVIGGGAIGVCCAEALARAGRSVLLVERGELCSGSSWGNAGLLTTSSAAPEAAPGVVRQAARWMLDRDGPFRFRPRPDRQLAAWMWRFRASCNAASAADTTAFLVDLVRRNTRLVSRQAEQASRDFRLQTNGLLGLHDTEEGLEEAVAGAEALRAFGIPSEPLDRERLLGLEPRVTPRIAGGILYPEDAHLDPGEYVRAVAELAEARGARIAEHSPVRRLHGAHRVEAVETAAGTIRPELVVLAAGAWTPRLLAGEPRRLLVEPGRGFSLTYDVGATVFERPLRLGEIRTIVRSVGNSVRVTSKLDLVGLDEGPSERRARSGVSRASRYVELPAGVERAPAWSGLRPLAPDGLPYIGRTDAASNVIAATGHGHLGISLAAITGEAVAGIASGDGAPFDLARVRPDRFRRARR
jgi:D-amino-acid dehydrogenase